MRNIFENEYKRFYLLNFTGPDFRFNGALVSSAERPETDDDEGRGFFLYITKGGSFVCHKTQIIYNSMTGSDLKICDSIEQVKEFFWYKELAKKLYSDASICFTEDIE